MSLDDPGRYVPSPDDPALMVPLTPSRDRIERLLDRPWGWGLFVLLATSVLTTVFTLLMREARCGGPSWAGSRAERAHRRRLGA